MDNAYRPQQLAHQSFFIRSELGQLEIRLDWQTTRQNFIVTVRTVEGVELVSGRLLCKTLNLLDAHPEWGALLLAGKPATLENLGLSNELRWMDLDTYKSFVDEIEAVDAATDDPTLAQDLVSLNDYNMVMAKSLKNIRPFEDWREANV